jgi:hypothetical protein
VRAATAGVSGSRIVPGVGRSVSPVETKAVPRVVPAVAETVRREVAVAKEDRPQRNYGIGSRINRPPERMYQQVVRQSEI